MADVNISTKCSHAADRLPRTPKAEDGRWSVSCGVEARRGAKSCCPALHPRGVGVGGGQRPTNCSQRQEACPRVRAGGWYRFHQLVGSLEHSALRAQIGVRTARRGAHARDGAERAVARQLTAPMGRRGGPRMGTARGEPLGS